MWQGRGCNEVDQGRKCSDTPTYKVTQPKINVLNEEPKNKTKTKRTKQNETITSITGNTGNNR